MNKILFIAIFLLISGRVLSADLGLDVFVFNLDNLSSEKSLIAHVRNRDENCTVVLYENQDAFDKNYKKSFFGNYLIKSPKISTVPALCYEVNGNHSDSWSTKHVSKNVNGGFIINRKVNKLNGLTKVTVIAKESIIVDQN